jgi:hypothetical protein
MHLRNRLALFLGSALLLGLAFGVLPTVANSSAADVRGKGKHQGKVGDQCSTDDDCQSDPVQLSCLSVGDKMQCKVPPKFIPPPVT